VIVWFADDHNAPEVKAIERLEAWLAQGTDRKLIYVGRDYDAAVEYWRTMLASAPEEERIDLKRMLADALTRHDSQRAAESSRTQCEWFTIENRQQRTPSRITGSLCDGIDVDQLDLRLQSTVVPPATDGAGFSSQHGFVSHDTYFDTSLLQTDDHPFVFSLWKLAWSRGMVVVVTNGSFLLNLPLTNDANRRLAVAFADEFITDQEVLFLENQGPVEISISDYASHSQWGWISQPPLRHIVPHLLAWCLVFCFVLFPIFGRPRRIRKPATTHFSDHIRALARLLSRAELDRDCEQWIQQYQRRIGQTSPNSSKTTKDKP
jgi:hypothetical protein